MSSRKEFIYWDSSIFLAWIMNEVNVWKEDFNGVIECVGRVEKNEIRLATSESVTPLEVLTGRMTSAQKERFSNLLKRRNVQYLPHHPRITILAKEIREFYVHKNGEDGKGIIMTPDAQHLATAIYWRVAAFYTFDDGKKDKRSRGLLSLNNSVAGYSLIVCKPPYSKMRLFFND